MGIKKLVKIKHFFEFCPKLLHLSLMFNSCLFKHGKKFYNTFIKGNFLNMSTNKKRFTVLNEDEILAKKVENFPCLYDKSSRSY